MKSALAGPWHFLILIALFLSGCKGGLKPFPTDRILEFDPKVPVCAEYRITDPENLKVKHVRDIPYAECPAIFGFNAADIPKVMGWGREARKFAKEKCK